MQEVRPLSGDKNKILEVDLCKPVCDYLTEQGYIVRSEVKDCDITAIKGDELVIVELKRNLSVELLTQAVKRQKLGDRVYIAIPKPKKLTANARWQDICHLIRRLELGLILVSFRGKKGIIEIPIQPVPFNREQSMRKNTKKREGLLKEAKSRNIDGNIGGSSRTKLVTAYREIAVFIACCLDRFGPLSTKQLRALGTDEKKTASILRDNHYDWFERVGHGVYRITDNGQQALVQYSELARYYCEKLEQKESDTDGL